jgi:spore maturation protein CgeB
LLEGNFNGILKEGEHYISVKKNFSNLKDIIDVYSDHDLRNQIVERTYAYISENHTYKNRVETITNKLFNI